MKGRRKHMGNQGIGRSSGRSRSSVRAPMPRTRIRSSRVSNRSGRVSIGDDARGEGGADARERDEILLGRGVQVERGRGGVAAGRRAAGRRLAAGRDFVGRGCAAGASAQISPGLLAEGLGGRCAGGAARCRARAGGRRPAAGRGGRLRLRLPGLLRGAGGFEVGFGAVGLEGEVDGGGVDGGGGGLGRGGADEGGGAQEKGGEGDGAALVVREWHGRLPAALG